MYQDWEIDWETEIKKIEGIIITKAEVVVVQNASRCSKFLFIIKATSSLCTKIGGLSGKQ